MERNEIVERMSRREWFHSIDLGQGVVSPGRVPPEYLHAQLKHLRFPERLDGLSVLDIGAFDGFFSFEAERRGARRVVAADVTPIDCNCFALAKELIGSNVEYHHMSSYSLDMEALGGPFDIVLFLGVFYHLRYPLMALDEIWKVTKGTLLMETHVIDDQFILGDGTTVRLADVDPRLVDTPLFRFYRLNELYAGDYSNWFGPNITAVMQSLRSAGFDPEFLASWNPADALRPGLNLRAAFRAKKVDGVQEFRYASYEGTSFEYLPDGTWKVTWLPHQK